MSEVIQLVKDESNPISDIDLFTAMENAKQRYMCLSMCNIPNTVEERMELNRQYRRAEKEYLALLMQCSQ